MKRHVLEIIWDNDISAIAAAVEVFIFYFLDV